ncbi:thioredoxin-dependent thiol peroxidase [Amphibacillus cookii]|uniref:thioredoxin-dependent thiol peroxidase n=1 Tax=Amphibacillus cookii TaxID=767787 RepID=UPI001957A908|nr:thioredoxin-dependent thiol peroxidase [Amphibacillus cookii]MBM7542157.1 peroxiredoxin Q/BCP [Amphibacillus cookii]
MTIQVGDPVPNLPFITSEGEHLSLPDFKGQSIVLFFYPKDNTPGCTAEACSFRDHHKSFSDLDTVILGVSPDSKESHEQFKEKHDLPFTLIVDEAHQLADEFGVWILKKKPNREYYGNQRSTFIIDKEGIVQKVYHDVKVDGHVEDALHFIREHLT